MIYSGHSGGFPGNIIAKSTYDVIMTSHDQIFVKISGIDSFIDRNVGSKFQVILIIETEVMKI